MEEFLHIIQKSPLFAGTSDGEILTMLRCLGAKEQCLGRGEHLLENGEAVPAIGLLLHGNALVTQEDFWGNRNLVTKLEPPDTFAEAFACSEAVATVSVVAETDCRVLWLPAGRLLSVCSSACQHHNRVIRNLLSGLAAKNLQMSGKITHISQRSTREKVLSYLSSQACSHGNSEFFIPFDRQQMADYLSVERTALSAELSKLKKENIIDYKKNHFLLRQEVARHVYAGM